MAAKEAEEGPRVHETVLVPFAELKEGAWFIFPMALERLVDGKPIDPESRTIRIRLKIGPLSHMALHEAHLPNKMSSLSSMEAAKTEMVIEFEKPDFVLLG